MPSGTSAACACGGGCPRCRAGSAGRLQRKPTIGAAGDAYEREADAVAERVMRKPDPVAAANSPEALRDGARSGDGQVAPAVVDEVLRTPGRAIDAETLGFFEPRFGYRFNQVRIHTGALAAESARAVQARAYTVGSDIVFADGQYAPGRESGRRLLAHELAHTVQQGGATGSLQRDPPDTPDAPLKEAKKEDATGAVEGGLKTVADAASKDDRLKNFGLGLAKQYGLPIWNAAGPADKAALIGGPLAIYGTGLAALLSTPTGRQNLSGINFLAPLGLVPYATLTGLSFDLPKTKTDPLLLHLSLKGDDLLQLVHDKTSIVPSLSLSFDMTLSVSPDGKVATPFAMAKLGVLPGVSITGGYGVASDLPQLTSPGAGQPLAPYKAFPQPAQPAPPAGAAVFVGVDLLKAPFVPESWRSALGGDTGGKR